MDCGVGTKGSGWVVPFANFANPKPSTLIKQGSLPTNIGARIADVYCKTAACAPLRQTANHSQHFIWGISQTEQGLGLKAEDVGFVFRIGFQDLAQSMDG